MSVIAASSSVIDDREIDSTRTSRRARSVLVMGLPSSSSTSSVERAEAGTQSPSKVVNRLSFRFKSSSFLSGVSRFGDLLRSAVRSLLLAKLSTVRCGICAKRLGLGDSRLASLICSDSNPCMFAKSAGTNRDKSAPDRLNARSPSVRLSVEGSAVGRLIESTSVAALG